MVTERADVEPILPMGQLVHDLGCEVCWKNGDLKILHPRQGLTPSAKPERMSSITTSSSLGLDRGNGGGGKSKNYEKCEV